MPTRMPPAWPRPRLEAPLAVVKVIQHSDGWLRDARGEVVDPEAPNTLILDRRR